jgi:polysaccharide biosynthesis transport protein
MKSVNDNPKHELTTTSSGGLDDRRHQRASTQTVNAKVIESNSGEEGGLKLGQIVKALKRRWWIVAIVNIAMVGMSVAWHRSRPPAYEGSFKMLIEPVTAEAQVVSALKGDRPSGEDRDFGSTQYSQTTLDYPTQIQILLSDKILTPVAKQLQSAYPKTSYEALRNSININRQKEPAETKILEVRYRSASDRETTQVLNLVANAYIQYSLNERQTNVSRAVKFVETQLPNVQAQVRKLETELQSFREKHQFIDPNTLGTQLGEQLGLIQKEQQATQVELAKTKQLYQSIERQLQLQPQGAEAASVLSEAPGYQALLKQLQELEIELQSQSALLTDEHPKIILLREKKQKLLPLVQQKANEIMGSKLSQSVPNGQQLPYQNALRQDLSKQLITAATQVQVLEAKLNELNTTNQTLSSQTSQLPIVTRQYETLQRQLKIVTEQQSKFLQKREELTIDAARQEVPWDLIAPPAVKKVPSSSAINDVLLGSVAGLLLGIGAALILERSNQVIYSLKDLREEIDLAILGMIPPRQEDRKAIDRAYTRDEEGGSLLKEANSNQHNYDRFSPFIESFRALNSQVRLLNSHTPIRSLVVSSSVPNEGKTTISLQLAQAAAAMGQRVLLVNADLRKPSSQSLVDRNPSNAIEGLTDIIAGRTELMDVVQLLPSEQNLYFLLAGSVDLDPTIVLSSQKMQELMKDCERNFDLVIYDTVPLSFADSLLLISQTDGLLMVARLGKVDREVLQNSLEILAVSKVPVLGLVVNMVADAQSLASTYYADSDVA